MDKLTHEQIDEMGAGREMDALVAELVMGWSNVQETDIWLIGKHPNVAHDLVIPNYSTDISAAWQVVIELANLQLDFAVNFIEEYDGDWVASLRPSISGEWKSTHGDTAPLAISRAALKAVTDA